MLENINLDDKNFEVLVQEALEELHRHNGQWTDQNLHDPGITFIELFAWLSEMQRYYLNRVSDASKENMFQLLGILKEQKKKATSQVIVSSLNRDLFLPKGMKFKAGDLIFQSLCKQWMLDNQLKSVHVEEDKKMVDKTRENTFKGIFYYPLGKHVSKDNKLYLGFEKALPIHKEIDITFLNQTSEACKEQQVIDNAMFLIDLSWEILSSEDVWVPVKILLDETYGLSLSGKLTFMVEDKMMEKKLTENTESAYWLRAVVLKDYNDVPSKQDSIQLNMVTIHHCHEYISTMELLLKEHKTAYYLSDYLQLFGENYLQIPVGDGYWMDLSIIEKKDLMTSFSMGIEIDQLKQQLILNETIDVSTVRMISVSSGFLENSFIGSSLELSNQVFELYMSSIVYKSIRLQVKEWYKDDWYWIEWQEVDTFDYSKSHDKHFRVDYEKSQIVFGDNKQGQIPEKGTDNIRMIGFAVGGGEKGNIREHEINKFYCDEDVFKTLYPQHDLKKMHLSNPIPATGGRDKEQIKDLHKKLLMDMNQSYVAVTKMDYEAILKRMPRLSIERLHVISNFDVVHLKSTLGHTTIVVMPQAEIPLPKPTNHFKKAVQQYLEPHRLLTTRLHIIGPCYVKVDVSVIIYVSDHVVIDSSLVLSKLNELLDPRTYPFGQTLKKSQVYRTLSSIKGIKRIEGLNLYAIDNASKMKANGDIALQDYCVAYSGEHNIDIIGS